MPSGDKSGIYYECGLLLEDRRKVKPKQDPFLLAAMFFKNLSPKPAKIVKLTRNVDGEKQWDPAVTESIITMPDGKKEIV